jgi:hypothetical protein
LFATRGRDNAAVAQRYLQGLTQASSCTFAAMADVVEDGCAQQFQHFISNSPWQHELVVAQIGLDADPLLGGQPGLSRVRLTPNWSSPTALPSQRTSGQSGLNTLARPED